jgi:signal transduction histidine kinase
MTPVDLKPQFTDSSFRALIEPLLAGRKDKEVFRAEHQRSDGSVYPVEVHLQLVEHEKERMFLAVIIDITERARAEEEKRKLQAQLLHSQKMEAVGQLAGGIAHDFNNILTAIIGYGNVALMSMEEDHPVRSSIDQMLSAADRAATLTQSLLAFSRRQIINPRAVSAGGIIERVQKLLHRIIGEDIELTTAFTAEDATVLVDAGQIEQVLINLCANARDAMPDGGHLAIETSLATIGEDYIRAHGYGKVGDYVLITVTDDGQGIDEQTRQRIFEPFFTTKEVGKGTGLGLAMAYGIVKQHSGYINVDSQPGRGTTFRIYLPRHRMAVSTAAASEPAPPPRGGTETVLLAEDDAQLRKLARSVLVDFGYTVIESSDGADAIEKFREHRDRVQIIVVDVVMPKKNGREVYEAARQIKPGVKVLFMSGYPSNVIASKGVLEPGITLLSKPLAPQDLLRAVRTALDL